MKKILNKVLIKLMCMVSALSMTMINIESIYANEVLLFDDKQSDITIIELKPLKSDYNSKKEYSFEEVSRIDSHFKKEAEKNNEKYSKIKMKQVKKKKKIKKKIMTIEDMIISKANNVGINPDICLAIARLETGWFKSYLYVNYNNPGGLMCGDGNPMYFNSIEDGVDFFINNLHKNYFQIGLTSPETIGPKYCPNSQHWIDSVNSLICM